MVLRRWVQKVLNCGMPNGVDTLNISLPADPYDPTVDRITRQSRQNYYEFQPPESRDMNQPYPLKSKLCLHMDQLEKDSDIYAVCLDHVVSVTPMTMLMGAPADLASLFQT